MSHDQPNTTHFISICSWFNLVHVSQCQFHFRSQSFTIFTKVPKYCHCNVCVFVVTVWAVQRATTWIVSPRMLCYSPFFLTVAPHCWS